MQRLGFRILWILVVLLGGARSDVFAHAGENHEDPGVNVEVSMAQAGNDFPLKVGGDFSLIDHNGIHVTNDSYKGKHMMVFFGYASCKNMCSITLSRVGQVLGLLGESAAKLAPLVITVDPERDTPRVLKTELAKYHSRLIGLTGDAQQLQQAYNAYQQKPATVESDWEGDPVISHSSYIYLMDQQGQFQTLFPPILNPRSMADIIRKYIDRDRVS